MAGGRSPRLGAAFWHVTMTRVRSGHQRRDKRKPAYKRGGLRLYCLIVVGDLPVVVVKAACGDKGLVAVGAEVAAFLAVDLAGVFLA